jgi:hypothetical protein
MLLCFRIETYIVLTDFNSYIYFQLLLHLDLDINSCG